MNSSDFREWFRNVRDNSTEMTANCIGAATLTWKKWTFKLSCYQNAWRNIVACGQRQCIHAPDRDGRTQPFVFSWTVPSLFKSAASMSYDAAGSGTFNYIEYLPLSQKLVYCLFPHGYIYNHISWMHRILEYSDIKWVWDKSAHPCSFHFNSLSYFHQLLLQVSRWPWRGKQKKKKKS